MFEFCCVGNYLCDELITPIMCDLTMSTTGGLGPIRAVAPTKQKSYRRRRTVSVLN
jgi:hypothetical protein